MKTFKSVFLLILIITGVSCFEAKGQVTIGSDIAPLSGVLLDIKSKAGTAGSGDATTDASGGGLGLPRVTLASETTLAPFLPSATPAQMKDRTGLMVYNISTTSPFKPGVYVWDGAKWNVAGGGVKWFYMPPINVDAPISSTPQPKTVNLYDKYKEQFTKSGNTRWRSSNDTGLAGIPSPENGALYAANQLDYVITYFDTNVFDNVSVNASGLMSYTVKANASITSATYFNIVFVVR
jgi:hypothetical protein